MLTVNNPQSFRNNIRDKLNKIIKQEHMCINLEKGIFNFTIQKAEENNIVKKWDNAGFVQIYIDQLRSIYMNIQNPALLKRIQKKQIYAHEVAFMTHQEMQPKKWKKLMTKIIYKNLIQN